MDVERTYPKRDRLLEVERATHRKVAEEDRRKDQFLATLGHELRNPLSAIVSALQVLDQLSTHDSVSREMYGIIKRQSLHLTRLIGELLDVSRIASGNIQLQLARLDIVALVKNAVLDHQHVIQQHFDLKLPALPMWVVGDGTRLAQVMSNLLQNAAKFTDAGGTISIRVEPIGTSAVLSVRDTGIGMDSTELVAMFEPFRQAESSRSRSQGGLGLGLAISKRLVEEHGGTITATSDGLGCGSLFRVHLPLDLGTTPTLTQAEAMDNVAQTARRVLIVDDSQINRHTVTMLLEQLGQIVSQAANGMDALKALGGFHPQLVLCDIGLPDLGASSVARAIRADPRLDGIRLVALTDFSQANDLDPGLPASFDRQLAKPVGIGALRELLREVP